jgi:hypothetical protein
VLIGFVLFRFVAPERNLDPYTLSMDDFNDGISGSDSQPRNVIPFNGPDTTFTCQAMNCIYDYPSVNDPLTGESYDFCGVKAMLETEEACSIDRSSSVMERVNSNGDTVSVEQSATDITDVSTENHMRFRCNLISYLTSFLSIPITDFQHLV